MTRVIEKSREVTIPNVGRLLRVEQQSEDGESIGVIYRPTGEPNSPARDLTPTFVVFVTAARVFIASPTPGMRRRGPRAWPMGDTGS